MVSSYLPELLGVCDTIGVMCRGALVEVRYLYAFKQSGAIYQPVFLGEREDIEPAECTVNQLKYRCEPAATIRV